MAKKSRRPKMGKPPMGNAGMMGQLQQLQQQLMEAQNALAEEVVEATAGGGVVKVSVTGDQQCRGIEINPDILEDADVEMLQDLLLTAFNAALDKSRDLASERLGPFTAGLPF